MRDKNLLILHAKMSCVKKNVQQVAYLLTQDSDYRLGSHVGIQNGVHEFYQRYQMTQFLTFTYQIPSFTDSRATYRFGTKINAFQCFSVLFSQGTNTD